MHKPTIINRIHLTSFIWALTIFTSNLVSLVTIGSLIFLTVDDQTRQSSGFEE